MESKVAYFPMSFLSLHIIAAPLLFYCLVGVNRVLRIPEEMGTSIYVHTWRKHPCILPNYKSRVTYIIVFEISALSFSWSISNFASFRCWISHWYEYICICLFCIMIIWCCCMPYVWQNSYLIFWFFFQSHYMNLKKTRVIKLIWKKNYSLKCPCN